MLANQSPETTSTQKGINVLLIDDDPDMPTLISGFLEERKVLFQLEWIDNLTDALARLGDYRPDVVLLDLHLPDSKGLNTFVQFKSKVSGVPIVVMTSLDDENFALEAVQNGAQDYLVKGEVNGKRLGQVLQHAVVRHSSTAKSTVASLLDETTGLYNRKGFLALIEQQIKWAKRSGKDLVLFLSFLQDLERIQTEYGESEAAQAGKMAGQILKESFRGSDILARIGKDRFVIIPPNDTHYYPKTIARRLDKNPKYYNAQFNHYKLSLSIGSLRIPTDTPPTPQHVIERVDKVFDYYSSKK